MSRIAYTHDYTPEYLAENELTNPTRVEVVAIDGGYVFRVSHDDGSGQLVDGVFWNSSAVPFGTVEETLIAALQYHSYPEVADYNGSLDEV